MGIRHCPVKVNAREKFVAHRSISILCRSEEPWTPAHAADKAFDTNTFVMKKKERRKLATSAADHSFNAVCRLTPLTTRRTNKRTNASLPRLPKTRHPIRATNNHPSILRPTRWMPQRQSLEQRQQLYLPSNPLWIRCESCKRHNSRLLFSSPLVLGASLFLPIVATSREGKANFFPPFLSFPPFVGVHALAHHSRVDRRPPFFPLPLYSQYTMSTIFDADDGDDHLNPPPPPAKLTFLTSIASTTSSSMHEDDLPLPKDINTRSLTDFMDAEKTIFHPTTETDMIKSLIMTHENPMEKSSLFRSLIEHTEPTVNAQQLTKHFALAEQGQKAASTASINEHLLRPFSECVEQYYRILYRVCECTEELKGELRQVKSERDQMSEDLINAENAYTDVKKRNEKLKLIINEHKMVRGCGVLAVRRSVSLVVEHRNLEAFLRRIRSLHRGAKTEICCTQATRAGEAERVRILPSFCERFESIDRL